jgi:hypothetical protein
MQEKKQEAPTKKPYNKIVANIKHELIEASINGLFRFASFADAKDKLEHVKQKFIVSKEQPLYSDEANPALQVWIKNYQVSPEEKAKGYIGNFALIKIAKTNNNRFSLVAEKIDVDLKLHPQKINDKLPHPSYQHWIFREIKEGKIYQTIDKPQGLLEKLHTDYPKISIPGINKLKIIVFNTKAKPPLERIIIEIKVHREGGFYLEMYENTYKRSEGLPAKKPKVVKNQEAEPNLEEEDKKGYYTSLIELKRNKKK